MTTQNGAGELAAIALAFAAVVSFYPAINLPYRRRMMILIVLTIIAFTAPLLIPPAHLIARFLIGIIVGTVALKMWDVHVGAQRGHQPSFAVYVGFVANVFFAVLRRIAREPQPDRSHNVLDLGKGMLLAAAAAGALVVTARIDWLRWPFVVEHAVKVILIFVAALGLWRVIAATTRFLGGYMIDPNRQPLLARTPADFWRRYNRLIGLWLYEDVFKVVGGLRHPVRGTLCAFAVSGLLHEYLLWIALGTAYGLQIAFFMLQGLAVALTLHFKPKGAAALIGVALTLAFNLGSSILFFANANLVVRIYEHKLPMWAGVF